MFASAMAKDTNNGFKPRFAAGLVVTGIWFCLSFVVALMMADADDSLGMRANAPLGLKVACDILLFPLSIPAFWDWIRVHFPEDSEMNAAMTAILINSFLWSYFLTTICPLVVRQIMAPKTPDTRISNDSQK